MSRPLSNEARGYIADQPFERQDVAERWAAMPSDEFQARVGPLLDLLQAGLARRVWWRSAFSTGTKVLGGAAGAFLAFWRLGNN